jgi:hypothetical protein
LTTKLNNTTNSTTLSGQTDGGLDALRARVALLSESQRLQLIQNVRLLYDFSQSDRLKEFANQIGLENITAIPAYTNEEYQAAATRSSFVASPSSELTTQQNMLKEMLERRHTGEDFLTRLASFEQQNQSVMAGEYPKDKAADVALYYDRVAYFYEVLAGPISETNPVDFAKLKSVSDYFSGQQPVEQSLFALSGSYGLLRSSDIVGAQMLLSLEGAKLNLDMQYMQMDMRDISSDKSYFIAKHELQTQPIKQTRAALSDIQSLLTSAAIEIAQLSLSHEEFQAKWAGIIERATADKRLDPVLYHMIQATQADNIQNSKFFEVYRSRLALADCLPEQVRRMLVAGAIPQATIAQQGLQASLKPEDLLQVMKHFLIGRQKAYYGTAISQLREASGQESRLKNN